MTDITINDSLIPYDTIVQEALRAVVKKTLSVIADNGGNLPGDHHFYISFQTQAAGVEVPERLRQQFSQEMTIVLQNKFSNLVPGEDSFSVDLSFNAIPATIVVPYSAITAFIDPSVEFTLQFNVDGPANEAEPPASSGSGEDGNVVSVDFGKR